jgi:hypothetical protein
VIIGNFINLTLNYNYHAHINHVKIQCCERKLWNDSWGAEELVAKWIKSTFKDMQKNHKVNAKN